MDLVQEVGAYAGLAAVVGLAVLSALYFSQARDLKRLREWAGRAPERTAEAQARAQQAPQGAVRPLPAKPATPGLPAQPPKPPVPGAQPAAKPPVPGAEPAAKPPVPGAEPAVPAQPAGAAPGAPGKPGEPAKPAEPAKAPPTPGKPAPATAAAAAGAAAKPAQTDGAGDKTKVPDPAKPAAAEPASAPSPATNGTDKEIKASPGPGQAPKVAAAAAGAAPAAASAVSKSPAVPKPPAARPPAPKPSGTQARPAPPKPASLPRTQTAVLPAQGPPPEDKGGWLPAPRYIALLIAGVLVVGAGATYAATELLGQDDDKPTAGQADERQADTGEEGGAANPPAAQRIDPGSVTVAVLNGTTVEGAARRISDKVAAAGFQKGNVTNAANLEGSRAESVVLYASGAKAEAREVADKLGISQIEEIDAQSQGLAGNATVVVIVGQDQA